MFNSDLKDALQANDRRIIITGAGGWLGLTLLDLLDKLLGPSALERVHCFGSSERMLELVNGKKVPQQPLDQITQLAERPSVLFHFAFLTKDRAEVMDHDAYCKANRAIQQLVLNALVQIGVQSVFLASSGAAYRANDVSASEAMRIYGSLKLEDELDFSKWAEQSGQQLITARIFNVSGPYINKISAYAMASFIADVLRGQPIAVTATKPVYRSYTSAEQLMSLALAAMLSPEQQKLSFDTGGKKLEMRELAAEVAAALNGSVAAVPAMIDDVSDDYTGDAEGYDRLMAQYNIHAISLRQQILETASYLKNIM
jgi:nucleoside-diphosphate-sugar epimerase